MTKYELARKLAEEALTALLKGTKKKASGTELFEWVKKNRPDEADGLQLSWGSFLTKATDDPESRVRREAGKYGYILSDIVTPASLVAFHTNSRSIDEEEGTTKFKREQKLYALLVDWLKSKDYRSEDTSLKKKGGAWGNPDIVGIREEEVVGGISCLELVSIEAKLTEKDWRRVFFEAVSHKRFADRAYFSFSFPSEEAVVSQLPEFVELREYGEKYRVGILTVFMDPKKHRELVSGDNVTSLDLSLDDVRVEEVWPAVNDPVSPFTRDRFIREVLEITNLKHLHEFGE